MNDLNFHFNAIPEEGRIPKVEEGLEMLMEEVLQNNQENVDFLADFMPMYMGLFSEREEHRDALRVYNSVFNRLVEAHRLRDYRDQGVGDLAVEEMVEV